jgi:hypothetical protein
MTKIIFNILAISGSAIFSGVLLAIGVAFGGYWKSLSSAAFLDWFGQNIHFIMRAIPVVVVPTVLGLAGSLWLGWGDGQSRASFIGATICIAAVLVLTGTWFARTNHRFAARSVPLSQVPALLNTWLVIHSVRIGLAAAASVLGIVAVR